MTKSEKAISWMETCASDPSHGYDQRYRWGEKGDFDCSSAVITAWEQAGVPVKSSGATYTGNMRSVFLQCGFQDVTSSVNLSTGEGLKRADVLLNTVHHTAMYCGNNKQIVEAAINEIGTVSGGMPGDQTGKEFLKRPYYNYAWNYVLRFPEPAEDPAPEAKKETVSTSSQNYVNYTVQKNDSLWTIAEKFLGYGYHFKKIMEINNLSSSVLIYPGQILKIPCDDKKINTQENSQVELPVLVKGSSGKSVKSLQTMLQLNGYDCLMDGYFGEALEHSVKMFQENCKLDPTGKVESETWKALLC